MASALFFPAICVNKEPKPATKSNCDFCISALACNSAWSIAALSAAAALLIAVLSFSVNSIVSILILSTCASSLCKSS